MLTYAFVPKYKPDINTGSDDKLTWLFTFQFILHMNVDYSFIIGICPNLNHKYMEVSTYMG